MDKKEKTMKLMELLGVIKSIKDELGVYRRTMGVRGMPFEISEKEEEGILEEFLKVYEKEWLDENELDRTIVFCESEEGKKIVRPRREFFDEIAKIIPKFLEAKIYEMRQKPVEVKTFFFVPPTNTLQ